MGIVSRVGVVNKETNLLRKTIKYLIVLLSFSPKGWKVSSFSHFMSEDSGCFPFLSIAW
jgi:hypothetical protein